MNRLETMWRFVQTGGPIMIPLVLVSIWMWYLNSGGSHDILPGRGPMAGKEYAPC